MATQKSLAELLLAQHLAEHHLTAEREYHFSLVRDWRFDFALVAEKLAVEIEGGVWVQGRHQRPQGFLSDMEKYNAALLEGWRVLRFSTDMVFDGRAIATIVLALGPCC